jgi:hypothetical protein
MWARDRWNRSLPALLYYYILVSSSAAMILYCYTLVSSRPATILYYYILFLRALRRVCGAGWQPAADCQSALFFAFSLAFCKVIYTISAVASSSAVHDYQQAVCQPAAGCHPAPRAAI